MLTLGTRVRAEIAKIVSRVCRRWWAMAAVIALAVPCRGGPVDGLASAIEAFKRHDHVTARDLASAAYAADGSADALELWALSSLRLGEIPRASALYGELADLPGAPPSVKKRAESQLSALRRQGARLTVTLTPAGANLTIDGNIVGTSPLAYEFALLPGKHQIRASLEGYTGREAEWVAKPGGRLAVEWALEAKNVGSAPMAVVSAPPTEPPAATPSPELRAVIPVRPEPVTTPPENAIWAPAVATRALRLVELRGGVRRVARRVEQEGEKLRLLAEDGSELVVDTSELVGLSILDDELVAGFGTRVSHALENLELGEAPRLIRLANGRVAAVLESAKTGARAQVVDVSSGLPVEPQAVVGALELGAAAVNVVSLKDGAQVVGQFLERTRSGKLAFRQLHGQVILLETETIERIAALRPAERVLLQDGTTLVGKILERDSSSILVSLPNGNQVRRSAREVAEARLSRWACGLGIDPDSVSLSVTKHGFEARIRLDEAEAKRRAWMDRGGVLPPFAVHATGVGILMPSTGGVCSTPNGGGGGGRWWSSRPRLSGVAACTLDRLVRDTLRHGGGCLRVGHELRRPRALVRRRHPVRADQLRSDASQRALHDQRPDWPGGAGPGRLMVGCRPGARLVAVVVDHHSGGRARPDGVRLHGVRGEPRLRDAGRRARGHGRRGALPDCGIRTAADLEQRPLGRLAEARRGLVLTAETKDTR
jgi:hypothetical protein